MIKNPGRNALLAIAVVALGFYAVADWTHDEEEPAPPEARLVVSGKPEALQSFVEQQEEEHDAEVRQMRSDAGVAQATVALDDDDIAEASRDAMALGLKYETQTGPAPEQR